MYTLAASILEQLQGYSSEQIQLVTDAFFTVEWGGKHGEAIEIMLSRIIHPRDLHRSSHFKRGTKKRVDQTIELLEKIAVVKGGGIQKSTSGRPKTFVTLDWQFIPSETQTIEAIHKVLLIRLISKLKPVSAMQTAEAVLPEITNAELDAPIYYRIPAELERELTERTQEEQEDILDAFHLWRWALDNLAPIDLQEETTKRYCGQNQLVSFVSPTYNGRYFLINSAQKLSTRFRKSPSARIEAAIQYLTSRGGICMRSLDDTDGQPTVTLYEEILPSHLWEATSSTHAIYSQTFEEAQSRFIRRLLGLKELKPVPTEPSKPRPKVLKALFDFKYPSIIGGIIHVRKGEPIRDPITIAKLIAGGYPVVPFDQVVSEFHCPKCASFIDKPEKDNDDTIRFLRPARDFTAFLPGQVPTCSMPVNFFTNAVIDAPQIVKYFLTAGRDCPTKPIKAHEFTRCKQCHTCVFFDEFVQA